jgi:hypothetical protein
MQSFQDCFALDVAWVSALGGSVANALPADRAKVAASIAGVRYFMGISFKPV